MFLKVELYFLDFERFNLYFHPCDKQGYLLQSDFFPVNIFDHTTLFLEDSEQQIIRYRYSLFPIGSYLFYVSCNFTNSIC